MNQERIMTKHGLLEEVYQEQKKNDPHLTTSIEKSGPVETYMDTEPVSNEAMTPNNMNMAANLGAGQMMNAPIENFEANLWNQDWNIQYNEANADDLMDPFFRIQDEFGKLRKL